MLGEQPLPSWRYRKWQLVSCTTKAQFSIPFPFDTPNNDIEKNIYPSKKEICFLRRITSFPKASVILQDATCTVQHIVYIPRLYFCLHYGKVRCWLWTLHICQPQSWVVSIKVKHHLENLCVNDEKKRPPAEIMNVSRVGDFSLISGISSKAEFNAASIGTSPGMGWEEAEEALPFPEGSSSASISYDGSHLHERWWWSNCVGVPVF